MNYNKNNTNPLFQKMVDILTEDNSIYGLVEFLQEANIFSKESYVGEPYDGIIFRIPLQEWNEKTGMNIIVCKGHFITTMPILCELLDTYSGSIDLETGEDDMDYVILMGSS